ncbi:MAG TPA: hypothetical protein VM847_02540, partial [Tahibacter sp.]|nr:hypothetical protein [Tahibacter sp.]
MLTALRRALLGFALLPAALAAADPALSLRPAMLDAPREALQQGDRLLAQGGLSAAQREELLRDMATAALPLSADLAAQVADRLDALSRDSGRASSAALADLIRARLRLEGDQIESGLALASSATTALRALEQPDWIALADLETCDLLLRASRASPALPHCLRAQTGLIALNDDYALARSENLLQWAYASLGDPGRALPLARAAQSRYERLGSRGGQAMMEGNSASLYLSLGQPMTALAAARRALDYELAHGKVMNAISSRHTVAGALAALGQPQQALNELDAALADARRLELGRDTAQLLASQAEIAEKAGRLDLALAAARELVSLNARLSSREVARAVAELDDHYDTQTREAEIRSLRQSGELQSALLRAAEADKAGERARARLYALTLIAALCV